MNKSHSIRIRVYHEDTDFSGFVYHGSYVRFCERGRSEFVRAQGISQAQMIAEDAFYVVRRMSMEFLKPAKYDDELDVRTAVKEQRGVSLILTQDIFRGEEKLFTAEVQVVCITAAGKPKKLAKIS